MHFWVSSLRRGCVRGRGKGAAGGSNSWGGGRISIWNQRTITLCSFEPQEVIRLGIPPVWDLIVSVASGSSTIIHQLFTQCAWECTAWLLSFHEACERHGSHWYPPRPRPRRLFTNHYFHSVRRPSGNEKTGARWQMFGEVIDLRWEDCDAFARDGHVIALENPQVPLT